MTRLLHIDFFERMLMPLYNNYHAQTYYGLVLYLFLAIGLCSLLATVAYFFSLSAVQDTEKRSEYECGFEPFDSATRLPFDVHFYLVGILFLIFDVEIALLFPWVLSLRVCGWFGFYLILGFIFLLSIGFLYEWKRGALIWPSRQREQLYMSGATSNSRPSVLFATALCATRDDFKYFSDELVKSSSSIISRDADPLTLTQLENADLLTSTLIFSVRVSGWTASAYSHLTFTLLPELLFTLALTMILTYLAIELGKNTNPFRLATLCFRYVQFGIIGLVMLYIVVVYNNTAILIFNKHFLTSNFIVWIKLLTVTTTLLLSINTTRYFKETNRPLLEFPIVLGLALLFILLLLSSCHLFVAFLTIIGFSLNTYVLIFFEANQSAMARESGVKYFYLSAFSSGLIIYGIFLIFFIFGTSQFFEIQTILTQQPEFLANGQALLQIGVGFLLVGLLFKLSAVPGHLWAPEVYDGAPDPVVGFFMLPLKAGVLSFLIYLLSTGLHPVSSAWQPLLALSAAASLVWGCFAAVYELKTKRFLAYASINQIGFLFLGLSAATAAGFQSTIVYLVLYIVINLIFLIVFLNARRSDGLSIIYITDFRSLSTTSWGASFAVAVSLFSIAGIPPLAGFFGKYYLLLHAQEQGLYGLIAVALGTSLISTFYYLRLIKICWFEGGVGARPVTLFFTPQQYGVIFFLEAALWLFILFSPETLTWFIILLADLFDFGSFEALTPALIGWFWAIKVDPADSDPNNLPPGWFISRYLKWRQQVIWGKDNHSRMEAKFKKMNLTRKEERALYRQWFYRVAFLFFFYILPWYTYYTLWYLPSDYYATTWFNQHLAIPYGFWPDTGYFPVWWWSLPGLWAWVAWYDRWLKWTGVYRLSNFPQDTVYWAVPVIAVYNIWGLLFLIPAIFFGTMALFGHIHTVIKIFWDPVRHHYNGKTEKEAKKEKKEAHYQKVEGETFDIAFARVTSVKYKLYQFACSLFGDGDPLPTPGSLDELYESSINIRGLSPEEWGKSKRQAIFWLRWYDYFADLAAGTPKKGTYACSVFEVFRWIQFIYKSIVTPTPMSWDLAYSLRHYGRYCETRFPTETNAEWKARFARYCEYMEENEHRNNWYYFHKEMGWREFFGNLWASRRSSLFHTIEAMLKGRGAFDSRLRSSEALLKEIESYDRYCAAHRTLTFAEWVAKEYKTDTWSYRIKAYLGKTTPPDPLDSELARERDKYNQYLNTRHFFESYDGWKKRIVGETLWVRFTNYLLKKADHELWRPFARFVNDILDKFGQDAWVPMEIIEDVEDPVALYKNYRKTRRPGELFHVWLERWKSYKQNQKQNQRHRKPTQPFI